MKKTSTVIWRALRKCHYIKTSSLSNKGHSRVFGGAQRSGIFDACCGRVPFLKQPYVEDPRVLRTATSGITTVFDNGFTLVELLVVVLIIGVLTAVALPQYTKSVQRADLAKMQAILMPVVTAQKAYYLENGEYATSLDDLVIDLPVTGTCGDSMNYGSFIEVTGYKIGPDGFCLLLQHTTYGQPYHSVAITFGDKSSKYGLDEREHNGYEYLLEKGRYGEANQLYCRVQNSNKNTYCTGRPLFAGTFIGKWYDVQ